MGSQAWARSHRPLVTCLSGVAILCSRPGSDKRVFSEASVGLGEGRVARGGLRVIRCLSLGVQRGHSQEAIYRWQNRGRAAGLRRVWSGLHLVLAPEGAARSCFGLFGDTWGPLLSILGPRTAPTPALLPPPPSARLFLAESEPVLRPQTALPYPGIKAGPSRHRLVPAEV